jgi:hypothetical protein
MPSCSSQSHNPGPNRALKPGYSHSEVQLDLTLLQHPSAAPSSNPPNPHTKPQALRERLISVLLVLLLLLTGIDFQPNRYGSTDHLRNPRSG